MDHCIRDDRRAITYADMMKIFEQLDHGMTGIEASGCVYLEVHNTLYSVILLLYLLEKQVNVFIASPNLLNRDTIPCFCNKVIRIDDEAFTLLSAIQIADNAACVTTGMIENNRGMVILASSGSTAIPK